MLALVVAAALIYEIILKQNKIKIFVYGSLLWDTIPFKHTSTKMVLKHFSRKLCIWSYTGRGTYQSPGLFWGIIPKNNANCTGKLLTFQNKNVLKWMDHREGDLYLRTKINGIFVYLPNVHHTQYDPNISKQQITNAYMTSKGQYGTTKEYVDNTIKEIQHINSQN